MIDDNEWSIFTDDDDLWHDNRCALLNYMCGIADKNEKCVCISTPAKYEDNEEYADIFPNLKMLNFMYHLLVMTLITYRSHVK